MTEFAGQPGLADRASLLESVVVNARDGVLITDASLGPEGPRILYANPAQLRLTGYGPNELLGRTPRMFQGPKTDRSELERIRRALEAGRAVRAELVNYRRDGTPYRIEVDISPVRDGAGTITHFISIQRDVTERRAQEEMMERSREFRRRLASLADEALRGPLDISFMQRVLDYAVEVVPEAERGSVLLRQGRDFRFVAVHGYDDTLLTVEIPDSIVSADYPDASPVLWNGFAPRREYGTKTRDVLFGPGRAGRIRATLGIPVWIEGELRGLFNLDNFASEHAFTDDAVEMGRVFGRQVAAILQRLDLQELLEAQTSIDTTTGLPNRSRVEEFVSAQIRQRLAGGNDGALMLLDVDNFKLINDAYGPATGDAVVREMGQRIQSVMRGEGLVGRWAGDEFMIVLPNVRSEEDVEACARELQSSLDAPFRIGNASVLVTASAGIVSFPSNGRNASEAIQNAHIALHRAKRSADASIVSYAAGMRDAITRRTRVEAALRVAIAEGTIDLHFQRRIGMATGETIAVEALARWKHPELGTIRPDEFIAIAEESGLIHSLGEQVLERACGYARRWIDAGKPRRVAVNLSVKELYDVALPARVRWALDRHRLDSSWLELEITETAAMIDVHTTIRTLRELRALGVGLSIDDFGTAYSSLAYLKLFPIDAIKIDRSFVSDLGDDPADSPLGASIVRAIVALGKSLGLSVVAEGVETAEQRDFLRSLGCDEAQGYFFGRPVPAEALDAGSGDA